MLRNNRITSRVFYIIITVTKSQRPSETLSQRHLRFATCCLSSFTLTPIHMYSPELANSCAAANFPSALPAHGDCSPVIGLQADSLQLPSPCLLYKAHLAENTLRRCAFPFPLYEYNTGPPDPQYRLPVTLTRYSLSWL